MSGHPQGERTPATAHLEDGLSIGELRALAGQLEHAALRRSKVLIAALEEARAVLEVGPERLQEEAGGDLVVLFVRLLRDVGHGTALHLLDPSVGGARRTRRLIL